MQAANNMVWEERWHPLRQEWVIVAAHRQDRPWSGSTVHSEEKELPEYLADCYLCPGNPRVSGQINPLYQCTFVFDNDHPSVSQEAPLELERPAGIYRNRPARGLARVVCYSPRHNLTLGELELSEVVNLLRVWQEQYRDLGSRPEVDHVLIFENKGEAVGVSNPHPHCQIYATNFVFKTIETEARVSQRHLMETGRVLFQDILATEREDGRRIICENDTAIAFLPYFARYAYEVFVAPKETHQSISELSESEVRDFAEMLKMVLIKMDNLWRMPFPYVMPLHQAPTDGGDYGGFHFHVEFHPPLRKPNLLKYLAGPEIGGGNFLSDTSPEEKAAELRQQSDIHYKHDRRGSVQ
ncbi:MAG TPA: galactose-1-phosphate uridylyltransferase [Pyrinomonadaceae bacterium]|nr:galactose-1-phosphate uridylyltransferase [Pyrinomonadaceae bacterium]